MTIKKQYLELITLLEDNKDLTVNEILEDVKKLCESKVNTKTFVRSEDGTVIAIFCYYHKHWELLEHCEYGSKKSSTHGFNTMCKQGVRGWTKQQSEIKKLDTKLVEMLVSGNLQPSAAKSFKEEEIEKIKEEVSKDFARNEDEYVTYERVEEILNY